MSGDTDTSGTSPSQFAGGEERLQKILARVGFGSRRKCEDLILEGRVAVNGVIQNQLGARADLDKDKITVDGERVRAPKPVYFIISKPRGWYSTDDVPDKKILDLIPGEHPRLFTVGRLDKQCEGLMLATNDGHVANVLTHPRYMVPKVYKIIVKGHIKFETIADMEKALFYALNGGNFERVKVLKRSPKDSTLRLIVYEGLPTAFRDICAKFGHPISRITRIRVGTLELGTLAPSNVYRLSGEEAMKLREYAAKVERGEETPPTHRLVTAEWIKKAGEREQSFEKKETGHRGAPSTGAKKRRADLGRSKQRR
ncbi:MAG: rRNA pseudouridine synthase [Planctomycetes bacterium]|nr:rRNA pseudouridine synthase [Planctomycetota bacterium]